VVAGTATPLLAKEEVEKQVECWHRAPFRRFRRRGPPVDIVGFTGQYPRDRHVRKSHSGRRLRDGGEREGE